MLAHHVILADDCGIVRHELSRIIKERPDVRSIAEVWTPSKLLELVRSIQPYVRILATPMPGPITLEGFRALILCRDERRDSSPCVMELARERYSLGEDRDGEILRAIDRICDGGIYIVYMSPAFFNRLSGLTDLFRTAWLSRDQSSQRSSEEANASTADLHFS
jgi:DNA-binding NarL/FixJ family response regulator